MSRMITAASLQNMSISQLRALHAHVQRELVQTAKCSNERREALSALSLISQALRHRYMRPGF